MESKRKKSSLPSFFASLSLAFFFARAPLSERLEQASKNEKKFNGALVFFALSFLVLYKRGWSVLFPRILKREQPQNTKGAQTLLAGQGRGGGEGNLRGNIINFLFQNGRGVNSY